MKVIVNETPERHGNLMCQPDANGVNLEQRSILQHPLIISSQDFKEQRLKDYYIQHVYGIHTILEREWDFEC